MKVAITGATGLVGSRIIELLQNDFEFIPLTSKDVDITEINQVNKVLNNVQYDLLLHLAAYTNVDKAEVEKDLAYKLNVEGTKNLFEITQQKKSKFIYISTEFVFDGQNPPYYEDSPTNPLGEYGKTKTAGEEIVKNNGMVVRIEAPYGFSPAPKKDFVRLIKSLIEQGKTLQMVTDSKITPTYLDDIAYALKYLINNYSNEIFHIVGNDSLSPFESGKLIAKTFGLEESLIEPTTYKKYFAGKAPRPQWAEVKSKKNNFYKMKNFQEGLLLMK